MNRRKKHPPLPHQPPSLGAGSTGLADPDSNLMSPGIPGSMRGGGGALRNGHMSVTGLGVPRPPSLL